MMVLYPVIRDVDQTICKWCGQECGIEMEVKESGKYTGYVCNPCMSEVPESALL